MRRLGLWVLACALVAALAPATAAGEGRRTASLDAGWRVHAGEAALDADTARWAHVTLPHTFNAGDGEDGGGYYRGPAWYRRQLAAPAPQSGRRLFLQFDGAALAADVYLNGRPVGRHEGGYAAFRFDVTDAFRPGTNDLAVRVDNSLNEAIAPLGGDFTVFGGLYRGVRLVETPAMHVEMLDHGGPGVTAHVTRLSPNRAEVAVAVRVRNDGRRATWAQVRLRILDAAGREAAQATAPLRLPAGSGRSVSKVLGVASPRLWRGRADPYLYRVVAEVAAGGDVDQAEIPLGLRTIAVDPQRGFLLNGEPLPLHGVNLFHSGRPGQGLAVTDDQIDEDFRILEELGVNAVRLVHFQHPQRAYELADRLGFVVWTEVPLNSGVSEAPAFEANLQQQLRELIRQNAQHPSVAFWGLGNEVYKEDAASNRILAALQATAKVEDPSRPTAYAHCCSADDSPHARHSDVIGYNRYFGWYPDQTGSLGAWADAAHAAMPGRAIAVSEYGGGASVRQQEDPPRRPIPNSGWHPEQYQARLHETAEAELARRPFLWGHFVWVAFDLASDGRNEGDRPGINDKGLVTYDRRIRKDAFYWYQANWSDRPMAHITSSRFTTRSAAVTDVRVYSNLPRLRLSLNGVDLGERPVEGHVAVWPAVPLSPGRNVVRVDGGSGVSDEVSWMLEPAL